MQAGRVRRRAAEGRHHLAQLVGLRPVLGVVDDQIFAAGELQREIAGLRLGLRLREAGTTMISNTPSRPSVRAASIVSMIAGLEHDLDVELAERIVEIA